MEPYHTVANEGDSYGDVCLGCPKIRMAALPRKYYY